VSTPKLTKPERANLKALVKLFTTQTSTFQVIVENLQREILARKDLAKDIHSLRLRVKDPKHLYDKLARKLREAKERQKAFTIIDKNLFQKINDLAGVRILHLQTEQFENINQNLKLLFRDHSYSLLEGPTARTWDDESRRYFKSVGIRTIRSPSLYTSVHYIVRTNTSARYTCEIQVRTLMEEVWGEVDHSINYPHKSKSVACREQILALARSTSACSRLVDSIFRSHADHTAK
jgi:ppGpp synthetase/RelA/SpoT-type nucleotidyltranferase